MTTSKHTPGPWTLGRTGKDNGLAIFTDRPTSRELVAAFKSGTVSEIDAQAMTAAPELLAALSAMIVQFGSFPDGAREKQAIELARAALAKAVTP